MQVLYIFSFRGLAMVKFVKKIIYLFSLTGIMIVGIYAILIMFGNRTKGLAGEVFLAREKAQTPNECTVVYLGDSLCFQLWSELDEDVVGICHIGCNQAITPAGSYLLLREYLENHPQTEEVYYIILPQTLGNDISLGLSYQYFVIPFCDDDNWALLDEETQKEIYDKFGKIFVNNQWVKGILLNSNLFMKEYLNQVQKKSEKTYPHRISKTAVVYLSKMRDLCNEYGVNLYVKSSPLADIEINHRWEEYEQDIIDYGFEDLLGDFIESIPYYPKDWFRDGTHFRADILEEYGDDIREATLN